MRPFEFDVIVIGAGPGGSAAAKRCAQNGLRVLLLEKHKLPRHKVCAGWIMGSFSKKIVAREFGEIPPKVLNDPPFLAGFIFHTPDGGCHKVEGSIPQGWRSDLDYWMAQQAVEAGAQLWDEANVVSVAETDGKCTVRLIRKGTESALDTRCVIGSDGSRSIVRRCLYPDLEVQFKQAVEQWYKGSLRDIEREYSHDFLYRDASHNAAGAFPGSLFTLGYKEEFFYVGLTNFGFRWRDNMEKALEVLAQHHGFDMAQKPVWTDSCTIPLLHKKLIDGSFRPALGNIMLVGDAAGLLDADAGGGGIAAAVDSGSLAADSIIKSCQEGGKADTYYLDAIRRPISVLGKLQFAISSVPPLEEHANCGLLPTAIRFAQGAVR
ncbi:MAG: NAD(P)/FAD-dependent oxidoreductase [Dehalococcoidia bacterium]|nr:NAD(P)/FAD-dependent oxidoreductase [Dehalococcoidia bacterium]